MQLKKLPAAVCLLLLAHISFAQNFSFVTKTSADGNYTWKEIENDPSHVRFYQLKNGLTVILAENHLEPRIMSLFAVKAGSKNDPSTNTGLAHYLEHMLFKGTDRYGSLDYEKEKPQLAVVEALYEKYNKTKDSVLRKRIYHQIDSVSGVAAKFAIANEYDKMMTALGSNFTNAFTSFENTTYMENIPSNNLDRFLKVQAERFRNPALRLFHTELEAVYEEKNIGLDNGSTKVFETMFASLFKNHPYGTQTTIGTVEHLKNPSLPAIKNYYNSYYVPNNMAILLTGDLNADETIKMIDANFGAWQSKPIPPFTFKPEAPRTRIEEKTVMSPDEEQVAIGFMMPSALSKEAIMADLVSSILYNGKSGLIDKNLVKKQLVLEAYGFNYMLRDYGMMYFGGKPLKGQTMQQVRDLVIAQITNLKKGNFDADLIEATVNNLMVGRVREQENPVQMAFVLHDKFISGTSWETYLSNVAAMRKLTKADVVAFANKWFGNNYTVVYKKTGEDKNVKKVPKPEIHPVEVNRQSESDFVKSIISAAPAPLKSVFLDFEKDITKTRLQQGAEVWSVKNNINNLFSMYYVLDMGKNHNQKLPLAIEYLKLIGTGTKTNEQINKELYKLAVDLNIFSNNQRVYVSIGGLQENFEKAIAILEDLLSDARPDAEALKKMVESKIKARNDATLNKGTIFWEAMMNYVQYGKNNPYNDVLSNEELRNLKPDELIDIIKSLTGYKHKVFYYGPLEASVFTNQLKAAHKLPAVLKDYPQEKKYQQLTATANQIYFVDYDMVQTEINMSRWDVPFDKNILPITSAFNQYYGGSMSSIVFQEIRESKALAYSAFSSYNEPGRLDEPFSSMFYVGTQADKADSALASMQQLLNNMPQSEKLWQTGKKAIKQNIETNRITKENILFTYNYALRMGLDHDMRKDTYEKIDGISLSDINNFHQQHLANKFWNIGMIGSTKKVNPDMLKKYGTVNILTIKDLFGYEPEKK
ncbi:MAG: insulinase family protein [Chitinophagaceae bacterium]|nr:insulinase family protein [Chitinophagaceae bacterium]